MESRELLWQIGRWVVRLALFVLGCALFGLGITHLSLGSLAFWLLGAGLFDLSLRDSHWQRTLEYFHLSPTDSTHYTADR